MPRLIDGTAVTLRDGREYQIPPLSVRTLRTFTKDGRLQQAASIRTGSLPTDEQLGAIVALLHAALADNYPELTEADVEGLLDMGNMGTVADALYAVTGFKRVPPGEAPRPLTGTES